MFSGPLWNFLLLNFAPTLSRLKRSKVSTILEKNHYGQRHQLGQYIAHVSFTLCLLKAWTHVICSGDEAELGKALSSGEGDRLKISPLTVGLPRDCDNLFHFPNMELMPLKVLFVSISPYTPGYTGLACVQTSTFPARRLYRPRAWGSLK